MSKDKWYSFEVYLLSYMSGLKDCGVIIIFCFPIRPIINFSNAFCRLTSFDSQVPERQKPSPDMRIGPLEWDIRCSACGKLWRGFLFYESQLWLMISSYESFGRNLFFFFCNSSLLDNELYLEISSLILQASTNIKKIFFRNEGLKNAAKFLLCCCQYFYFIFPRKGIQCCDLNFYDCICLFLYFFDNPWKSQYWNKLNLLGPRGCLCVSKVNK